MRGGHTTLSDLARKRLAALVLRWLDSMKSKHLLRALELRGVRGHFGHVLIPQVITAAGTDRWQFSTEYSPDLRGSIPDS